MSLVPRQLNVLPFGIIVASWKTDQLALVIPWHGQYWAYIPGTTDAVEWRFMAFQLLPEVLLYEINQLDSR